MAKTSPPIEWLLQGPAWIAYRTRRDLLLQPESDPAVREARSQMLADPQIQGLITELGNWPSVVIASHKSAGQPFHKLTFLADLGLTLNDPGIPVIIEQIFKHQSTEGPFQLPMNIGTAYGGSGQETWGWALCDAPLILYALAKFGLQQDERVLHGIEYLSQLVRQNGWPCVVSKELGNWRGPGRKEDPCPFANLAMLKLLSVSDNLRQSPAAEFGIEALLELWQESTTRHPYIFYMGDDFRKLKVPFIWYDLVHVLEVLSQFPQAKKDSRFQNMLTILADKTGANGDFTLESIWTAWKDWEFGQKKVPSRWLTLTAWRIFQKAE